jgi:sterol desaturase/sphingolipid hydroxylase (fatty acid hydroxylase superfamily)
MSNSESEKLEPGARALFPSQAIIPLLVLFVGVEIGQQLWRPLRHATETMSFGGGIFRHTVMGLAHFLFLAAPLVALEYLFPTSPRSPRSYLIGLAGWLPAWALGYVVGVTTEALVHSLGLEPLWVVKASAYSGLAAVLIAFLNISIHDFFYYWFHRLQHAVPALWRLHAVHHAIRHVNAVTHFHHPLEDLLRIIPVALPLALLVRFEGIPLIPILSAFLATWGLFIHSDTRISFGAGRAFVADGRYHRIHHSERPEHHNKNFAAFLPLWDRLFGTQYQPAPGEYPTVGLAARPAGMTPRDYFLGLPAGDGEKRKTDHVGRLAPLGLALAIAVAVLVMPALRGTSQSEPAAVQITDFGPNPVKQGEPFNVQPNGNSAIWIKTSSAVSRNTGVMIGSARLTSVAIHDWGMTAAVQGDVTESAGKKPLRLVAPDGTSRSNEVSFEVLPR